MSRTATSKYGFWLAGYYEDWLGSRVIADDDNAPSTDGAYNADSTHHGNTLNGEATLNPRYRWSVRDRANNNEFSSASSYLLNNDGIARWATLDKNRLGKGVHWAGRSQIQYPNSNFNSNRVRFRKADVSSSDDAYMLMSGSSDSSIRYYIPNGDTDASYGRSLTYSYNARNWFKGQSGLNTQHNTPDFMQWAHLTGVWMGERVQLGAYNGTTGAATTHENTPEGHFIPIKSKSKKPFLCVTTYLKDNTAHQLNNQAPSGAFRPVIASSASLNSKSDNDFFTIRMSAQAMMGYASPVPNETADSSAQVEYVLKVGFPVNTSWGTTGSGGGTPAINWTIRPHDGTGLSGVVNTYHSLWIGGNKVGSETADVWFDLDFKLDYTNNKFKVYHDGTEVTATNATAGSYSSGYTMPNNTQTSAAFLPSEMTGWELFVTPNSSTYNNVVVATMIDRVALYRPLTDIPDGTLLPAPVDSWTCTMPVNGVSQAQISILDDDTEQNLTPWFTSDDITDWRLLMFSEGIDRPLWNGIIEKVNITQTASDRTRKIVVQARDSLSLLDRQITSWEIGQIGVGTEDKVLARTAEISTLTDSMFMGVKKFEETQPSLGYESATSYKEFSSQRTKLNSAHPIQMYNNEDVSGPNNVEEEWSGYWIKGVNKTGGGATEVILAYTGTTYTTSSTPDLFGFLDHNKNNVTINAVSTNPFGVSSGEQVLAITGLTYVPNASVGSGVLEGYGSKNPKTQVETGYKVFTFSTLPLRSDGSSLTTGDVITVPESATGTGHPPAGFYTVNAIISHGGKYYIKTDSTQGALTTSTGKSVDYTIEKGFISDTTQNLVLRDSHAVWMRQLAKSPWFKKHFGVFDYNRTDRSILQASITADATVMQIETSLFDEDAMSNGVAQIETSDGFLDTFTYEGYISPALDGNTYLVGVNGLSLDHYGHSSIGDGIYFLTTSQDYKHIWLQWADMRNNADADADGGFRKKSFGLMKPVAENYNVSIAFTDQLNDDGSYDNFTDLKIGTDVDIWELDAEIDPSTNAPWSNTLAGGSVKQDAGCVQINNNSGIAIKAVGGGSTFAEFRIPNASIGSGTQKITAVAAGDKIYIMNSSLYNGIHTIHSVTAGGTYTVIVLTTTYTAPDPYTATGPFIKNADADNRESVLRGWEDKAGSLLVYDCSKFFNLNTFINGGTYEQRSGGTRNVGDYETEFHGFPVLMDNYWAQAASTNANNASPYGFHENFRKWVGASGELNRKIEVGDTVIETKPSSTLITDFPENGFGKMKASRGINSQTPSFQNFYYTYDAKLDSAIVETATSNAAVAGALTITCSGADFVNDGVKVGMRVRNVTAKWVAQITSLTGTTIVVDNSGAGAETGSTRQDVQIGDSISIPQQLYGVYTLPETGINSVEQAETLLQGILLDPTRKANGSTVEIDITSSGATTTAGAFDEVIIVGSISPRYALRFMMNIDGHIVSPNSGTYWLSDKARFLWSLNLSKTWLAQSSISSWFDIGSIPMTNNMTTDGNNANFDSFGTAYDARGGKSMFSILRESVEATGFGYDNNKRLPITYQIGRDNKIEIRPTYNSGEVVNRDILSVSNLDAQMSGQITNVRVYYNNGSSFSDFPEPTLNQTYRWKIVEVPEITFADEALSVAKEEYYKAKTKAIKIKGEVLRDLTHDDKMLDKGRYGYIADPTRHGERGVAQQVVLGASYAAVTAANNHTWSSTQGTFMSGMTNALDGNMGRQTGSDAFYRDRFGKGFISPTNANADQTEQYYDNYWWVGAASVSHAVQVVNIPSGCPLVSDGDGNELRVWVALKDGQSGTDIENAEFTIGLTDMSFTTGVSAFTNAAGGQSTYSPTLAANDESHIALNVSRNGFYEIDIPSTYWSGKPSGAKFTISVNVNYLKALLYHRCGDPTASGILHNAHNITDFGPSAWTATNADSIFPIGARKYDSMSGLMGVRAGWYAPRLHIVEDLRWRPATTVTFSDSGLGLASEPMVITRIDWRVDGRDIESVNLALERDQTKDAGGLAGYLYPSVSRGRGQQASSGSVGGGSSGFKPKPRNPGPLPPPQKPEGTSVPDVSIPEGAKNPDIGGAFLKKSTANNMSSTSYGNMSGRMDFLEGGVSGSNFGILGQKRTPPPLNTQRAVDGIGDNQQPTSGTSTISSEGMVFTGIVNPESNDRYTQTHNITVKVPDDVANEMFGVAGYYSLGGDGTTKAVITATIECVETGASITRTMTLSGDAERQAFPIVSSALNGASTQGNTIKVTMKRTPATGDDNASFSSLIIHNLSVNFQRFSVLGSGTSSLGFKPY